MILADTSAWVEFIRGTNSAADQRISELLIAGDELAMTEPVVMEVAAGARSDGQELDLRRLLARCHSLPVDVAADFDGAVVIYRSCRRNGVTPRGLLDCMIATIAWRNEATVLAWDADLARIAAVMNIPLDPASLSL